MARCSENVNIFALRAQLSRTAHIAARLVEPWYFG
jgi:hypothetical protein